MDSTRRVFFFAVSSSIPFASDFCWKFSLAGKICPFNSEIYTQKIFATQCSSDDVAVGISFSGEAVDRLRIAGTSGAITICITTFIKALITKHADIKLFTAPVTSLYQKIDLPSKMSHTAIMDIIYLLVVMNNKERVSKSIGKSEKGAFTPQNKINCFERRRLSVLRGLVLPVDHCANDYRDYKIRCGRRLALAGNTDITFSPATGKPMGVEQEQQLSI